MARPFKDKKSGRFFVSFSYWGKRYRRSTGTANLAVARRPQRIVDARVSQLKTDLAQLPRGVQPDQFVFDGKESTDRTSEPIGVDALIDGYFEGDASPNKAMSTCRTEPIHLDHLRRFHRAHDVGTVDELDRSCFEAYKRWRNAKGKKNVTINKELGTFRTMLNVAVKSGVLEANPLKDVKWLKDDSSFDRFRTGEELDELVKSGDYAGKEIQELYNAPQNSDQALR